MRINHTFLLPAVLILLAAAGPVMPKEAAPEKQESERRYPCLADLEELDPSERGRFAEAVDRIRVGRCGDAARILQPLYENHPDGLVRLNPGEEAFASVREAVNRLAVGPCRETLADYFNVASGDMPPYSEAALTKIARGFPPGRPAENALALLACLYFEAQRYEEALWALYRQKRIGGWQGMPVHVRALGLSCLARLGDLRGFDAYLAEFGKGDLSAKIILRGREISVADCAAALRKKLEADQSAPAYNPLFPAAPKVIPIPRGPLRSAVAPRGEALVPDVRGEAEKRHFVESYPTVSDGVLYLRTRRSIFATRLSQPGRPLWMRTLEDGAASLGGRVWAGPQGLMRRIYPAVASGKYVLTLAPAQRPVVVGGEGVRLLRLVCLDRRTGRVLWRRGGGAGETAAGGCHFAGAPVVVGGSVFAVAIRPRPGRGEEYLLVRLDAESGAVKYIVRISTQIDTKTAGLKTAILAPPAPPLVKDGVVFVATNAGAVVACDALFGGMIWAARYDQSNNVLARPYKDRFERATTRATSFAYGPLVFEGGRLFVAPAESDGFFAFASDSGRLLWRLDNSNRRFAYLLAAHGGAVFLGGEKCGAFSCETGRRLWLNEPDVPGFRGRGIAARRQVIAAGRDALLYFSADSGEMLKRIPYDDPAAGEYAPAECAGTLLFSGRYLLSVSGGRIVIFDCRKAGDVNSEKKSEDNENDG